MPAALEREVARRGGVIRVRTITWNSAEGKAMHLPRNTYRRVYVVRERGKRGGRTVLGPVMRKEG